MLDRTALGLLILLTILFAGESLHAQSWPINFTFSYSAFAGEDSSAAVQFDIQFSDRGLTYIKGKDGAEVGKLYTHLAFRDIRGGDPYSVEWVTAVPKPTEAEPHAMVGTRTIALPPGNYKATIYIADIGNKEHRDSIQFDLKVPSFAGNKLQVSDIQIATDLVEGEEGSIFYKNGYLVMPNVSGEITAPFLVLNTYMEIYNIDRVPTSEFHILYGLAMEKNGTRKIFYSKEVTRPRGDAKSVVEVNSIPLDSLPSGNYVVVVRAYNGLMRSATDSTTIWRAFKIVNPEMDSIYWGQQMAADRATIKRSDEIDPMFAGKKEAELDEDFAKAQYIAVDAEKVTWRDLTGAEAKARFLSRFWNVRDETPGTPENEGREAYYKRVEEARNLYRAPMSPKGWDSDRGRILLQYGKPDGIERHVQDFNRKPYEIWVYSQLGYEFVFVDRTQTGLYRLVHSTAPGEIRFENWEQEYTPLSKNWKDRNE